MKGKGFSIFGEDAHLIRSSKSKFSLSLIFFVIITASLICLLFLNFINLESGSLVLEEEEDDSNFIEEGVDSGVYPYNNLINITSVALVKGQLVSGSLESLKFIDNDTYCVQGS